MSFENVLPLCSTCIYAFASLRAFFVSVISLRRALTALANSPNALRARVPAALLPFSNFSCSTNYASKCVLISLCALMFSPLIYA